MFKMRPESCREGKDRANPWEYILKSRQSTHMTRNVFKGSLSLYEQNIRNKLGSQGLQLGSHSVIPGKGIAWKRTSGREVLKSG